MITMDNRSSFSNVLPSAVQVDKAVTSVAEDFMENMLLELVFEVHRAHKHGCLFLDEGEPGEDLRYQQVNQEGLDIFGHGLVKKSRECVCPKCNRALSASRFAPHLEKCMGMGRNSSRIASRRIQNSTRDLGNGGGGAGSDDDAGDDDWIMDTKRKRKRDKSSPRRTRKAPTKSSEGLSVHRFTHRSPSERLTMLASMCGVVSEHTRKMCTRSVRCPQHTQQQRRAVRETLCGDGVEAVGWEAEAPSSVGSPADSTSTTSHSSTSSKHGARH